MDPELASFCSPSADKTFGPAVSENCRGGFDFTLLFEQSILSLAPSLLLFVCALGRILHLSQATVKILPSYVQLIKLSTILVYGCVQLALLVLWTLPSPIPRTRVSVASTSFSLINTVVIGTLSYVEHKRSIRPSVILNVYLFFSLLFDATQVRTLWLLGGSHAITIMLTIGVTIKAIIAWLEALGKGSLLSPSFQSDSPEALSGIYSRSVFWWLNHLLKAGWQKILTFGDLYALHEELESDALGKMLGERWKNGRLSHLTLVVSTESNARTGDKSSRHAMLFTTLSALKGALLGPVPARLCLIGFNYSQPFLVTRVINYVSQPKTASSKNTGYGLIGATAVIYIGLAVSNRCYLSDGTVESALTMA